MSKPNPNRSVGTNENLALRIAHERNRRGWTMQHLANEMAAVGCPIHHTAIYKIEKGKPQRKVSFEEAVALARVFNESLESLAMPIEAVNNELLAKLLKKLVLLESEERVVSAQRQGAEAAVNRLLAEARKSA